MDNFEGKTTMPSSPNWPERGEINVGNTSNFPGKVLPSPTGGGGPSTLPAAKDVSKTTKSSVTVGGPNPKVGNPLPKK